MISNYNLQIKKAQAAVYQGIEGNAKEAYCFIYMKGTKIKLALYSNSCVIKHT